MTENMPDEIKLIDNKLKELEENTDYKEIKEKLDKGNNFIDYFLIIGLEPDIYKNDWFFNEDLESMKEKYKEEITPKIISSFPNFQKSTIAFDDSILIHCFPNKYELMKSKTKPKQKLFSFILDNNYYNLNYPQKYLTCLICYESIVQYKILSEIDKNPDIDLKSMDRKNITSSIKDPEIYIPKCLLIMSLYPYFGEFEKIITEIYNYSLNLVFQPIDQNPLPKMKEMFRHSNRKISFRKMSTFAEVKKDKEVNVPIEKIIENLLIELPVPPRGVTTVKYFLNEEERTIKQNEMNELPLLDVNLKIIFLDFEIKDIITIYNYIFLESRILFFSKNIEILNNYIYGLLALLYPFQYQYQIVTILPEQNFEIIESITPFIAGINKSYEEDFFVKNNFVLSDCIMVVDIDKGKIDIVNKNDETIPEFPSKYRKNIEKKLQDITFKYFKKKSNSKNIRKSKLLSNSILEQKKEGVSTVQTFSYSTNETLDSNKSMILTQKETLNSIMEESNLLEDDNNNANNSMNSANNILNNEEDDYLELLNNFNIDYLFNQEINDAFFDFNANLLSNYNQFLNRDFYSLNTSPCLEILFKVPEYLKTIPLSDKKFYDKFITETQIFGDFIYLRMIPKNSKEKIRILKFDEKINENSSNSKNYKKGVFTYTKEYEFVNKYAIQKPRPLTIKEIEFYKNKNNRRKLLEYGVIVREDNENKIIFNYPIFPKLTTSFFLADNIEVYFPPNNWNEDIDLINEDIISKSHLGDVSIRLDDMKKYIYLCWMQLWALTFWYCEENEKRYRFQELIKIIEKSSCYEMEIFNLLFEVLSVYGKDYMVLKLYDVLIKRKLNPSFKAHNIVLKLIENKKVEGNFSDNLKKIIAKEEKNIYTKYKFSPRTFRSKYYPTILTEDIKFYAFDTCIFCQKDINLELISKNLKQMNRDLNWTRCPNPKCDEPLLPKLTIQFGEEINKNGDMAKNTCMYETEILFSPYILKNNYNTAFSFSKIGIKLDVDEFMMKYSNIFWDSLWYFKLNNLEYDFMMPYYYKLAPVLPDPRFNIILVENEKNVGEVNDEESGVFDTSKFQISNFNFIL